MEDWSYWVGFGALTFFIGCLGGAVLWLVQIQLSL